MKVLVEKMNKLGLLKFVLIFYAVIMIALALALPVTVMVIDYNVMSIACHNSYLQSILNFGLLGTAIIYIPLFVVFVYRMLLHFSKKKDYDGEDIKILQLVFSFAFIVFGFTVDFFIDWPFMMLYFM